MPLHSLSTKLPLSFHYDFYLPEGVRQAPALLICTHGYSQDKASSLKFGQTLTREGVGTDFAIAALQAPHPHFRANLQSVGFGWVSPFEAAEGVGNHHKFVQHVIERAFAKEQIIQPKAFLFGFSQSVSLNYRFAKDFPTYVQGIIAVAGAAPSDWRLGDHPELNAPVLHIATLEDEAYSIERSRGFRDVLESHFKNVTYLEEPGGHRVPKAAYPKMRTWLKKLI